MTDIKKVSITSAPSNKKERKEGKRKRTIRILLTLPESNEKSCPEFNYGDLLSQHLYRRLGKERLGDVINGPLRDDVDPNASDEDEALRALARQFEKKYGGGVVGGPRRRKNKKENDFKQLGEGYDETDPFIDNSDAVDDVLATNMETKLGGFYINSGLLKFEEVQVSEDEGSSDSYVPNVKKRRQNEISSSDEGGEDQSEIEKSEAKVRENGVLKVKKRKLDEGEMLRRRKKMIDKFNAKKQKQRSDTSENEMDSKVPDAPLEESKTSNGMSIAASIEAVVSKAREGTVLEQTLASEEPTTAVTAAEEEEAAEDEDDDDDDEEREDEKDESTTSESSTSSSSESSSSESDSDDEKEEKESGSGKEEIEKKEEEAKIEEEAKVEEEAKIEEEETKIEEEEAEEAAGAEPVPAESMNDLINNAFDSDKCNSDLPSDVSPSLIAALDRIKEFAKNNKTSSQKFFTEPVNKLLLSIEIKLVNFGVRKKNMVYNHLSQHLPCGTQTLIKRGKNLLAERLEERLKPAIKKLKDALDQVMPPLIEAHAIECQKIAEKKGEGPAQPEEENTIAESNKKLKLPKKKFEFTPELKELFLDIVRTGSQRWNWIRKRSETAESYVKSFIDSHLKNLWPKGWVTTKFLYKESQPAHAFITAKSVRKAVLSKKVTVLDGGTVSNANIIHPQKPQCKGIVILPTPPKNLDNGVKMNVEALPEVEKIMGSLSLKPLQEMELKPSVPHAASQTKDSKNKEKNIEGTSGSSMKRPAKIDKDSTDRTGGLKSATTQILKVNPPKSTTTTSPPKDSNKALSESQLLSVSPASESSPKSFHGFESPTKSYDVLRVNEVKQSLVFDSLKKSSRISVEHCDSLLPLREGKPPKPSLTATALPKISIASIHTFSKADGSKKGYADYSDLQKTTKDDRKTITCITIKSVEKINETVGACGTPLKADKGKDVSGHAPVELSSPREKRSSPATEASISGGGVRVIDLASEDVGGRLKGGSAAVVAAAAHRKELICSIGSSVSVQSLSCESSKNQSSAAHISSTSSRTDSFSKNHKLQQEMDQVMNELLQISKKNLNSSGGDEFTNKHESGPGPSLEPSKSPPSSRSLDSEISTISISSKQQRRPSSHSSSQGVTRTSPVALTPYDLTKSLATVQPSKISPFTCDANDLKNQVLHHSYQKQNSSSHAGKTSDLGSLQPSSHSTNTQYGSAQHGVHQGAIANSHSLSFGGSPNSVKQGDGNPRVPQNSSGHTSYQNSSSSRTNPCQDSYIRPSSNTPGNQGTSSSHIGSHRSSPSSQSSNHSTTPSMTSPSHGMTPPSGTNRPQSLSQSSHRTSPSAHSGSHRPSSSSHALSSSHHRSSTQSANHRLLTISHSENHGSSSHSSNSSSHGSVSGRDPGASQVRGYTSSHSGGAISSQSGLAGLPHGSTHNSPSSSSSSNKSQNSSLHSPNPIQNISSRSSKPSHNIEGLLYNSSSSTKNNSTLNLTQSHYSHSQHSSHHTQSHHQSSATQRTQARFPQSSSGSWNQESSLTIRSSSSNSSKVPSGSMKSSAPSKHKSTDNSYSATGSSNDPLANLRLMEGLSVSNVPKKSQSLSVCSNSGSRPLGSSSSQRSNSSVQPKVKQRSDSFSVSMPAHHPFGNLTAEQQQELWQQMNASGYLPGISPDIYKYMPQQGLYPGSNSTGSSNKKASQY